MMYTPTNQQRYDAASPQPVYPPYLMSSPAVPSGSAQPAFRPEPAPEQPAAYQQPQPQPQQPHGQQPHAQQPHAQQPHAQQPSAYSYPQPGAAQLQQPAAYSYPQPGVAQPQPSYLPYGYQPTPQPGYPAGQPAAPQNIAAHQQAYAAYHHGQRLPAAGRAAARRPRVLTAAVAAGLAGAGLTVGSQVLALMTGRATIEAELVAQLPAGADAFQGIIAAAIDDMYRTIQARALLSIGLSVLVAVLVSLCLRANLGVRIGAVLGMTVTGLLLLLSLLDVFPAGAGLVGWGALALFAVSSVLLFMPAIGRYRADRSRAVQVGVPIGEGRAS